MDVAIQVVDTYPGGSGYERAGASAGGLTKMGTGTMTLTGANTYSGGTIVNSGALLVKGSIQSPVIVATGGTFGGTGSSTAAITALVGSTLTGGGWL